MTPAPAQPDRGAQAERTTMAWVRTALAVEATGLLAVRALHFRTSGLLLGAVTTVLVALFVLTTLLGLHRQRDGLVTGAPGRRSHPGAPVAVTLLLVALCAGAAVLLLLDGPR